MKILHVLAQLPARTGSGVYYANLIKGLAAYGHTQAAIYACRQGDGMTLPAGCRLYPVQFQSAALPLPIVGMSEAMPYESIGYAQLGEAELAAWQNAFRTTLQQAKAEFAPDILILHHLWMLTSLAIEIFPQQPKIGVCHNTDLRLAQQLPNLKSRYVSNISRLDRIFALSDFQWPVITAMFGVEPGKIVTMGGGFDDTLFYPDSHKAPAKTIRLVYCAKITPSKGVFELIRAFQLISRGKPQLHLDIIGTADEENATRLHALIQGMGQISVLPALPQAVLADYLRQQDIFVLPSYFEGLGLIALESLASGLRVVATEIEGLMALLGPRVNASGVIEYVPLPRIYDLDKPHEEDLDAFAAALAEKLLLQITRVAQREPFPAAVWPELGSHSWKHIAERVQREIRRLCAE